MSPRVVFVSPVPLDSPRGNAITVARIAQGLRARGLDVCVKCTDDPGLTEPAPGKLPWLVHAFHAYRAGPRGLALARSRRAPLVITLTGTDVSDDLQDPTRGQQAGDAIGWLRPAAEPLAHAILFDFECGRLGEGVVVAQNLEERAVAGCGRLGDDQPIGGLFLGASTAQPDL